MRILIALGGNALLRRSDPMTTEVQRRNIMVAARAIAPLATEHSVVIVHGNGPQVGLLSLQADAYKGAEPYPLDVLDAGTQGMIGYLIQQELRGLLPAGDQVATLLTMIVVDPDDAAFVNPTKFVGPVYPKEAADQLAADKGWAFREDGSSWRRVVPSPKPQRIVEIEPIKPADGPRSARWKTSPGSWRERPARMWSRGPQPGPAAGYHPREGDDAQGDPAEPEGPEWERAADGARASPSAGPGVSYGGSG
jgi:hypothetical protein